MSAGLQAPRTTSIGLRETAGVLGISVTALRRRIAAGQIKAELIQRPRQCVWKVYLDTAEPSPDRQMHSRIWRHPAGSTRL
jgi:hypothetical protein